MTVKYEVQNRVAIITIDRPDRRNAIDGQTAVALRDVWTRFDADKKASVAILHGEGEHFCAGLDLKALDAKDHPHGLLGMTRSSVSKPTIAAIEGYCVGGGLELALWCDIRIASESAKFGFLERRFGVPLMDGGTQRLPRVIGEGFAMEMILTGRIVDALEAVGIGLVNRVVGAGGALEEAIRYAARIADFPQETVRSDRAALIEGLGLPIEEGLEIERSKGGEVFEVGRKGAERFVAGAGRKGRHVASLVKPAEFSSEDSEEPPSKPSKAKASLKQEEELSQPSGDSQKAAAKRSVDRPIIPEVEEESETEDFSSMLEEMEPIETAPSKGKKKAAQPAEPALAAPNEDGSVVIDLADEQVPIWFRLPPKGSGPGVLLLHDKKGIDEAFRTAVEKLARCGMTVLAVDLGNYSPQTVVKRIKGAMELLIDDPATQGTHVGMVGYGIGGGLAMWYSTIDERVKACVSYRGRFPTGMNPMFSRTKSAYLGHYSDSDPELPSDYAYTLETKLRDLKVEATFHTYPGVTEPLDDPRSFGAAELAWERTVAFLDRVLA